jgi:hypothetical protein
MLPHNTSLPTEKKHDRGILLTTSSTRPQESSQMIRYTIKGEIIPTEIPNDQEALRPEPGTEADFEIENNSFTIPPN